jgi:pimeloyl-ACP methyl ester carboxylesterase
MMALHVAEAILLGLLGIGLLLAAFTWWTARRVLATLPAQGRLVDAGGVTFNVLEQGQGQPLVLIHGLAGQMRHFTYGMVKLLAPHFRVVAIDRPGSGHSVRPATMAADVSTQAAAIAALLDKLQLGPAVIVGHSLGGAIALTLAVEQPRCVAGLALVAPLTHLPPDAAPPEAFRALTIETGWLRALFAWTLVVPATMAGSRAVLEQVFGPEAVPGDFAGRGGGLMSLCPHQFIAASRDMQAVTARLPAVSARYHDLHIPVRVLFGRQDRILDWKKNGQALADTAPQAKLTLVDGGHMLPVTQVEATVAFVESAVKDMGLQATI